MHGRKNIKLHVYTGTFGVGNIPEKRLATDWTIRGTNPGGSEIFHAVQTGRKVHQVSNKMGTRPLLGVKRPGRDTHQPSPSSTEVATGRAILLSSPRTC